jgi:hypothetical protein
MLSNHYELTKGRKSSQKKMSREQIIVAPSTNYDDFIEHRKKEYKVSKQILEN